MHFKPLTAVALGLASLSAVSGLNRTVENPAAIIDAQSDRGTWEGWGTSLAWWAKRFGDRDDLADIFFTLNTTSLNGDNLPGLGMTIARHNAGACSWNAIGDLRMAVSERMMPSRQIEGHWIDWMSDDPTSPSWQWDVDKSQRAMLQKAKARGANRFELFSNSPMWWMTQNRNPSGHVNGTENIQPHNLADHAKYMATVAQHARDNWGIDFESVEPFNEPSANWWMANGTQEGCNIDVYTQGTIINLLRAELDNRGLGAAIIAASDESYYDQAADTLAYLADTGGDLHLKRVNVHGYQYDKGSRDRLSALAATNALRLWNSEYGEDDVTGRRLAGNLMLDFRWLRPTAWVYWQVLDNWGWGLVRADNESGDLGNANQKYFVLAQFARHIRQGMRILDGGADNVVAAYDAAQSKLVIVAVNWGNPQNLHFDLSGFAQASTDGATVARWRTQTGDGDRYIHATDTKISGKRFHSFFQSGMVQTFEIENVKLF
ncbi:Endo-beta-1,6-galactanase [Colletotrichum tanaceti]|uniref:Endo-beta-1,6-galactanase n=1 Tax=Colletotrichum tanaceti TaxID=1306861 RepID=A0A4U6XHU5_9PEZI|nr:Endo-beta-1,6-galactanase [Colletotrichum tanaceti]TKW55214.1 Endo-beta-1,6-galactanase [Colletotrichum tanaceti]